MKNSEVIAKLSKKNLELEDKLKNIYDEAHSIYSTLYCIGGPLNDNVRNYTNEQLKTFIWIRDNVNSILSNYPREEY